MQNGFAPRKFLTNRRYLFIYLHCFRKTSLKFLCQFHFDPCIFICSSPIHHHSFHHSSHTISARYSNAIILHRWMGTFTVRTNISANFLTYCMHKLVYRISNGLYTGMNSPNFQRPVRTNEITEYSIFCTHKSFHRIFNS